MQIQVRDQVLDIWRSVIAHSWRDNEWHWGGTSGSNAISDAEQLLCILYPATNIPSLRFDQPDETSEDVRTALRELGGDRNAPRIIVDLLLEYVQKYRDESGAPSFACEGYLDQYEGEATTQQRDLEMVDAFSMSVTLMLAALGFIQVLRQTTRNSALQEKIRSLDELASARLTAAMIGLLRSFSVNVFDASSDAGQNLIRAANQGGSPARLVAERFAESVKDVRASLREELSIGSGQVAEELDSPGTLFECGWSWGVLSDAPEVEYGRKVGGQRSGVAEDRPYLYFTVVAMDGIEDLFSERTRVLGLLDEEQQRMAQALQLRWTWCSRYWTAVALFGGGRRWPIEDLPWRTTDGRESDYYTLLLTSVIVQRFTTEVPSRADLGRLTGLFDELAKRGRITRRAVADDSALRTHHPGMQLQLRGSETLGPRQGWTVTSYSSLLLKRVVTTLGMIRDTELRAEISTLADDIWEHLLRRRIADPVAGHLWDEPRGVYPLMDGERVHAPSWYHTERIVECMVNSANVIGQQPPVSPALMEIAMDYLAEAEHLFDQEKLSGNAQAGFGVRQSFEEITADLDRARRLVGERPGTAVVLAQRVLDRIEAMAVARTAQIGSA